MLINIDKLYHFFIHSTNNNLILNMGVRQMVEHLKKEH